MDSLISQQSASSPSLQVQRMRAYSNYSDPSINRGAIHKNRSSSLSRTISASHADRLYQLALDRSSQQDHTPEAFLPTTETWLTPQSSPQQRQQAYCEPTTNSFNGWDLPTPPRSDSGLPTVSVDANEVPVTTGISSATDFSFDHATATSSEMRYVHRTVDYAEARDV
jgi:hypothetical protein